MRVTAAAPGFEDGGLLRRQFARRSRPAIDERPLQGVRRARQDPIARGPSRPIAAAAKTSLRAGGCIRTERRPETLVYPLMLVHERDNRGVFSLLRRAVDPAVVAECEQHGR